MKRSVLIVEDDPALAAALAATCRRMNAEAVTCPSGAMGLDTLDAQAPDLAILDIGLPDMNGLDLMTRLRQRMPALPILIVTAHGNLANAIAAKKQGANAYLVKPFDLEVFAKTVAELIEPPGHETSSIPAPDPARETPSGLLVGTSPAMQQVFIGIAHACLSDAQVLITGPTGTGKSQVARIIHYNSPRQAGPFVTLHCGSLPESLLESELFGHEKNAFTGASAEKTGHLERAAGGTLFLDEIGEVPLSVQTRLLRFVEEKVFTRVGGREDRHIALRLIAATNRELRHEVQRGRFREDLYFRLRVLEIAMPPLEQRREDIPLLCSFFLGGMAPGRRLKLSPAALRFLRDYPWPGNVRELRNAIEHAVAVSSGNTIRPEHLPREIFATQLESAEKDGLQDRLDRWLTARIADGATYDDIHQDMESLLLSNLLARFEQKPTLMARALKMNRSTLLAKRRRQRLRIRTSEPEPQQD